MFFTLEKFLQLNGVHKKNTVLQIYLMIHIL